MSASILPILLLFDIAIHWAQPPLNLFVRTYMQISLEINLFSGRNVRFAVAKLNKSSLGRLGKAQKKQKKKTQLNIRFPFAPYTLGTWGIYHCELHSFIQLTGNKNDIVHALAWKWAHIHERSKRKKNYWFSFVLCWQQFDSMPFRARASSSLIHKTWQDTHTLTQTG